MLPAKWFTRIHERFLADDPTATVDLFEATFSPLKQALTRRNPGIDDETLIDDSVTDALFDYVKAPQKFDPAKAGLFGYLEMAAQSDLKNALARRRRRWKRQTDVEAVEVGEPAGKNHTEGTDILTTLEANRVWHQVAMQFDDPKDREMVELVISGERSTEAFAKILGIEGLPVDEQRRQVKRQKDRIKKRLKQIGERIRDDEG